MTNKVKTWWNGDKVNNQHGAQKKISNRIKAVAGEKVYKGVKRVGLATRAGVRTAGVVVGGAATVAMKTTSILVGGSVNKGRQTSTRGGFGVTKAYHGAGDDWDRAVSKDMKKNN